MRAATYRGDRNISVQSLPVADPAPDQVQISVAYVGLCGTDLHVFHGDMDRRVSMPAVLGHEMSGTISAVGASVTGWAPGERVSVIPLAWDGTCPACRAGNQHICQNLDFVGIDSPGALQERWNVRPDMLVRLPDALSLRHAALTEPVAVAVHDVRRGEVAAGDRVVVLGGGPIGVLIATVAAQFGAEVVVVEPDAHRRAVVASLGLQAIDPGTGDLSGWVDSWSGGAGADVVFEVSGAASAVLSATDLVKVRGRLVVVAIHGQPRPVDLHRIFWRELTVVGARVYQRADFDTAVDLLARRVVPADRLITRTVPLEETGAALTALGNGAEMKVLVELEQQREAA
jgi:2-desacetyl-2-hydroxyethyl bacteriochlorophyllide A dehydrogenase